MSMPVGQTVTQRWQSMQSPPFDHAVLAAEIRERGSPRTASYVTVTVWRSTSDDSMRPYGQASTHACSLNLANTA